MGKMGLDSVLDAAENLSLDEQETLVDILSHRIAERRRSELAKDVRDAQQEFRNRGCSPATPGELVKRDLGVNRRRPRRLRWISYAPV